MIFQMSYTPLVPSCLPDQQALQSGMSSLEQWEKGWQTECNPGKCTAIRVMPKKTKSALETSYILKHKMLKTSQTNIGLYIGVSITDNLKQGVQYILLCVWTTHYKCSKTAHTTQQKLFIRAHYTT